MSPVLTHTTAKALGCPWAVSVLESLASQGGVLDLFIGSLACIPFLSQSIVAVSSSFSVTLSKSKELPHTDKGERCGPRCCQVVAHVSQ